jgi:hypothetical protein
MIVCTAVGLRRLASRDSVVRRRARLVTHSGRDPRALAVIALRSGTTVFVSADVALR